LPRRTMRNAIACFRIAALIVPLLFAGPALAAAQVDVVASFSILADMVREVGGDRVAVTALVGPNADVHVYAPAPRDAKAVAQAGVLVINGLGLEGWMPRLVDSARFHGTLVQATKGVAPLRMNGRGGSAEREVVDPHAWQSLADGKIYVANIRDGL